VPGCVHLDLIAEGVIPDPHCRSFEHGVQWVGETDWEYETEFEWDEQPATESWSVVFDGLDGVATIRLNGSEIGKADNAFLPYRFPLGDSLVEGVNRLTVHFSSPVKEGLRRRNSWMTREGVPLDTVWFDERAFLRTPAYAFGWDWGPRLVTSGISGVVRIKPTASDDGFLVTVAPGEGGAFRVQATPYDCKSGWNFSFISGSLECQVDEIGPGVWNVTGGEWWPRGMGPQTLHSIRAMDSDGTVAVRRIGLKTVRLIREPDDFGESFELIVNGERFWARGANWIPGDSFLTRYDAASILDDLETFAKLNFNMLRVWGGGRYESEAFYDACDELGIMVWQDFPFACMYYPDTLEWQSAIRDEAEFQVRRISQHVSLSMWCGNNENLQMYQQEWGGEGSLPNRYFGQSLYDEVLPEIVSRLDPSRPYIPSSPIGVDPDESVANRTVNMDGFGDSHYWDVWHGRGDWIHYRDSTTRFSSEFGFASSCSLVAWHNVLSERETRQFPNETIHSHNKTGKPWPVFLGYVESHYPRVDSLEDWTYYSQLNQRDALRFGIEHFRRLPGCAGSLIWQANDCWPVQSWSVRDAAGQMKPAGFELARLYDDLLISTDYAPGSELLSIWLTNHSLLDLLVTVDIEALSLRDGSVIAGWTFDIKAPARVTVLVTELEPQRFDPRRTLVRCSITGQPDLTRWVLLCEPKDILIETPKLTPILGSEGGYKVVGNLIDAVAYDANDWSNAPIASNGFRGWKPQTNLDGIVHFQFERPVARLAVRHIGGEFFVDGVSGER